jgi:chromosome segregation ATPase
LGRADYDRPHRSRREPTRCARPAPPRGRYERRIEALSHEVAHYSAKIATVREKIGPLAEPLQQEKELIEQLDQRLQALQAGLRE